MVEVVVVGVVVINRWRGWRMEDRIFHFDFGCFTFSLKIYTIFATDNFKRSTMSISTFKGWGWVCEVYIQYISF